MSQVDISTAEKLAKKESGQFTIDDVSEYLRSQAKPNAKVYALKQNQWNRVGDHQIFLAGVSGSMDDAWIYVYVCKHNPWTNWLVLPLTRILSDPVTVVWWSYLPDTNLTLDVWYVGDGSGGVPLVFESK